MTQLTREQMLAVFDQRRSCRYYDANKKLVMQILLQS